MSGTGAGSSTLHPTPKSLFVFKFKYSNRNPCVSFWTFRMNYEVPFPIFRFMLLYCLELKLVGNPLKQLVQFASYVQTWCRNINIWLSSLMLDVNCICTIQCLNDESLLFRTWTNFFFFFFNVHIFFITTQIWKYRDYKHLTPNQTWGNRKQPWTNGSNPRKRRN